MGKAVGITEEDAEDAISYWQQVGVILDENAAHHKTAVQTAAVPKADSPAEPAEEISAPRAREKAAKMISVLLPMNRLNAKYSECRIIILLPDKFLHGLG